MNCCEEIFEYQKDYEEFIKKSTEPASNFSMHEIQKMPETCENLIREYVNEYDFGNIGRILEDYLKSMNNLNAYVNFEELEYFMKKTPDDPEVKFDRILNIINFEKFDADFENHEFYKESGTYHTYTQKMIIKKCQSVAYDFFMTIYSSLICTMFSNVKNKKLSAYDYVTYCELFLRNMSNKGFIKSHSTNTTKRFRSSSPNTLKSHIEIGTNILYYDKWGTNRSFTQMVLEAIV